MNFTFDFGPTTSYGLYMPPNMPLPTASPFTFTAGVGGLVCGSTYHYRAKIVTSTTTIYGLDRTFVACVPAPHPGSGTSGAGTMATMAIPVNGGIALTPLMSNSIANYFTLVFGNTTSANSTTANQKQSLAKPSIVFTANGGPEADIGYGDSVNINWAAENIQPKSCIGYSPDGVFAGWDKVVKNPTSSMTPNTVTTYAEVLSGLTKSATLVLTGCVGTDGSKVPDQSVSIVVGPNGDLGQMRSSSSTSTPTTTPARKLQWTDVVN